MGGILVEDRDKVIQEALEEAEAIFLVEATTPLASWSGNIAQVGGYVGQITSVVIRKGSQDLAVPAALTLNDSVELHAFGYLSSSSPAVKCGMSATVTKPDGTTQTGKYEMLTQQNPGQTLRFSIMNLAINQSGTWKAAISYYAIY